MLFKQAFLPLLLAGAGRLPSGEEELTDSDSSDYVLHEMYT